MPSRPDEHQLEDKSFLAFRKCLPGSWVFRRENPDYGIDGSVEIFDGEDSTGLRFHVQIKATSQDGKREARLKREAAEYYRELDLPVLIVLYVAPEDLLLARWMHQFDPYYGGWGEKWITLTLTEEDIWRTQTPQSTADTVEKVSKLQDGSISFPVEWGVYLREEEIGGVAASRLDSCLRRRATEVENILQLKILGQRHFGRLEVDKEEAVASIADRHYCTLHLREKEIGSPEQFAASLLVLTGLTLAQADLNGAAAQIFSRFAAESSVAIDLDLWGRIARCMIRADRIPELLQLSEQLHDKEKAPEIIPATYTQILSIPSLSEEAKEAYEEFLVRRIERAEEEGLSPASTHYNYGNFLRGEGRNLKAFKEYRRAAEENLKYWEKDYFCRKMAAILFDEGRYRLSAELYKRALELGGPEKWRPLYADALAHSGQYAQAFTQFQNYIDQADEIEPYWFLKAQVLGGIVKDLGIEGQRRNRPVARKASRLDEVSLLEKAPEDIETLLHEDALCASAWFKRGVRYHHEKNDKEALFSFVAAGVAENDSLEAWTNAVRVALGGTGSDRVSAMIVQAAYNRYGERFVMRMSKQMENTSVASERLLSRLFDYLRDAKPENTRRVRLWNPEGGHDSFQMPE